MCVRRHSQRSSLHNLAFNISKASPANHAIIEECRGWIARPCHDVMIEPVSPQELPVFEDSMHRECAESCIMNFGTSAAYGLSRDYTKVRWNSTGCKSIYKAFELILKLRLGVWKLTEAKHRRWMGALWLSDVTMRDFEASSTLWLA